MHGVDMGVPGYCLVSGENREGASESGCRRVTGWIGVKVREADVYACYSWVNGMARITINTIDSRLTATVCLLTLLSLRLPLSIHQTPRSEFLYSLPCLPSRRVSRFHALPLFSLSPLIFFPSKFQILVDNFYQIATRKSRFEIASSCT